jgi:hypothetical protein
MAKSVRNGQVRLLILTILDPLEGSLPEPTLQTFLNMQIRPRVEENEFRAAVSWLSRKGFIGNLRHSLDENLPLWFIKEKGQVALRRH